MQPPHLPGNSRNLVHSNLPGKTSAEGDATGGLIPYKNPSALWAYYLGYLSILPLLGLPFGIAAFVLGIIGLQARQKNPHIKGSVHAAIGIGRGGIFALTWLIVIVVGLYAFLSSGHIK